MVYNRDLEATYNMLPILAHKKITYVLNNSVVLVFRGENCKTLSADDRHVKIIKRNSSSDQYEEITIPLRNVTYVTKIPYVD